MTDYINRGFARLTTKEELENPPPWTAYIPHHGVYHPRKPDKLRIVFDMSAKSNGVSLNDCLLKGPDFLTSLLGVLLRFRTGFFSIVADIEKMFHQVHVRTEDQAAMRFLWRHPGDRAPPMTYQMTVFLFGSVCSPSVCSFALRKTATDSSAEYPGVVALVTDNFYVDNYLGSVNTTQEGKRIVKELTTVLKRGGFRLTGWFSSSREIMASVEKEERADSKWNHTFDPLPTDHALGVLYSSQEDAFLFKPVPRLEARTHRAVLSAIMSIFDPLGVLAPVVIDAKCILQEIVRRKLGMDDELPEDILRRWQSWNHKIKALEQFHLNRCFRSRPDVPVHQELHVCTDASEKAYGASAYLRLTFANGDVEVSFVMGKARVASLTQLSIPRLELEGAVLGHRLATAICEELRLPLKEVTFWTDSRTALCWIHGSRRYKAFVAHRVGEIGTTTGANQWRHIPGVMNPADHASRGVDPEDFTSDHIYITGPGFLRQNQEDHPAAVTIPEPNDDDPEVSTRQWVNSIAVSEPEPLSILFNRITWVPVCRCDRITRIVAWMRRFIYNVRAKRRREEKMSGPLTIQELGDAFTVCLKHAQAVCFPKEMKELEEGRPVPKSSQLLKLSPFLDPDGIIRVGGRLQKAMAAPDVKYPVVIPSTHRLEALIIWRFHVRGQLKGSHVSSERLLAELRSMYWIVGGRKTIQRVVRSCFTCRRQRAKAVAPKMAPLPVYRLEPRTFPFVNTGMDFCGPFYVVIGRSSQKRWVCLFTCMVTRATHLELTSGLDTETFMMAFQRFADLRGTPSVLLSDNGTNFVGARKELTEEAARLEDEAGVREELTKRRIEWRFNPPYSPHFGSIWERAVRTAKTTLKVVLGSRSVNEEVFRTVLGGVAALMNSRPLTHVSPSPDELEPLTPNHFLLGRANPHLPLITVNEKEVLSRRHFRAAQALLDCYWKRWTTEYLPTLNERKKWWSERPEIRRNDFVLVMEPNTQRGQWNIGRIVESIPGQDQVKRVVRVRTAGKTYTRSVHNLVFLCRPEGLEEPQQPKAVSWPKKTVGRRSTKPQLESIQEE